MKDGGQSRRGSDEEEVGEQPNARISKCIRLMMKMMMIE
jgi:hypothetical protein